jgi:dynein intermediate chain 2
MEVVYVYQRKRREFGRQCKFSEKPADLTTDIAPNPSYAKNLKVRNPIHMEVQVGPDLSEHEVKGLSLFTWTVRKKNPTQ